MKLFYISTGLLATLLSLTLLASPSIAQRACDEASRIDNRGIEKVVFKKNARGEVVLQAKTNISLGKSNDRGANLSFDLYASVNGVPAGFIPEDIVFSGAITCAVTCSGECPSIFGDGICSGCNCSYSNWLSLPLNDLRDGDVVELEVRPARGGKQEVNERDDRLRIVFDKYEVI